MFEDGDNVRLITDILDETGDVIVEEGTVFSWDDSSTHQLIDGELIYVEEDEVELT